MEESWNVGMGCSQVRDEIIVKAPWGAVGDGVPSRVSYCGLLYTTRRWLGSLVDHLGSWIGFTFPGQADWQTGRPGLGRKGKRVAALLREVETTRRSRVCRQPVRWAPKGQPHQTTAANSPECTCQGNQAPCDGLSVCPSARVPVRPGHLFATVPAQPIPSHPILPGPPEREAGRLESGSWSHGTHGELGNEVSGSKGRRRRSDIHT